MELLHPAMSHDHDTHFARWLHPAMWHVALESCQWIRQVAAHPAMWYVTLRWHAIKFARWQHPAMWHVALKSWHWIRQVGAPCSVAGGSEMTCHGIRPNVLYWNSTSGFDFDHITAVDMSFCTSLRNFIQIRPPSAEKKWRHIDFSRWRITAIFDFRGPIMGSLKIPCTISHRSSIDTIALNCLVFEKIAFLYFGDRRTDGQARCMKSRAAAS